MTPYFHLWPFEISPLVWEFLTGGIHELTYFPVFVLIITFLHNLAFNAGTFYLALYFQVCLLIALINQTLIFHFPLGSIWFDPSGGWYSDVAVFPRFLTGFYASRMVDWILSEKDG